MSGVPVDWSTVDWKNPDADDPQRFTAGFRSWMYYAQPIYAPTPAQAVRGVRAMQPREFRASTVAIARKIIALSPEGRGHIQYWSERTQRRINVEDVTR